ncbi:MAG: prephenate dehydratase [Planctomycetota bacterium]|jgi:chorismate mutase/prephenate dehydratase
MSKKKNLSVAFIGPPATFADVAARSHFGSAAELVPMLSLENVFIALFRGNADYGISLLENSFGETTRRTLDLIVEFGLKISAEIVVKPTLHLMAKSERTKIKRIYATPDVVSLCRVLLERDMPDVEVQQVMTTSIAASLAAKKRACAAIAGEAAAEHYGLVIRKSRVQDDPDRTLRFLVIGKEDSPQTGNDKTLIFFALDDKPGRLCEILDPLRKRKINGTRIESRPAFRSKWDYYFFLEFRGHRESENVKAALDQIESQAQYLVVLGSFAAAEPIEA